MTANVTIELHPEEPANYPLSRYSGAVLRGRCRERGKSNPKAGTAHPKSFFWLTTTPISSNISCLRQTEEARSAAFFIRNLRNILPSLRHTAAAGTDSAAGRAVCPANRRFEIRPAIRLGGPQTAVIRLSAPVRQRLRARRHPAACISKFDFEPMLYYLCMRTHNKFGNHEKIHSNTLAPCRLRFGAGPRGISAQRRMAFLLQVGEQQRQRPARNPAPHMEYRHGSLRLFPRNDSQLSERHVRTRRMGIRNGCS